MVVTLTGSNSFLLNKRRDELVAEFIKVHGNLALERLDGAEAQLSQIIEAVQAMPFLTSKKMVVIRDLGASKDAQENIEQIISSTAPTTDLVIFEPSVDRRSAYFKVLKAKTQLEDFKQLEGSELAKWVVSQANKISAELKISDANYLIDRIGTNQAILSSELDKLALYDNVITKQSIDLLTEKTPQSKIFDLLDAAFAGRQKQALELYEQQRIQKVEPQAILALITWQLNLIALCKAGKGKSSTQIAADAKQNPYPVTKAQNLSTKIDDNRLKDMISEALRIDFKSKSVGLDIDEALKTYIATF